MIGLAQLMVVLDATIVNIALPSAQQDLGFSDGNRQWIVTAYALAFGSLLLLGGRIADLVGRKIVFLTGLVGFAVVSAIGGAAPGFEVLVVARALQGLFAALLAPAALSLLTTTFNVPNERAKAFGIYGAIAGTGGAVGLLLGGVLTEYLNWRWCLYVNLLFALVAFAAWHPAADRRMPPPTVRSSMYRARSWSRRASSASCSASRTRSPTNGVHRTPGASSQRAVCSWWRSPGG